MAWAQLQWLPRASLSALLAIMQSLGAVPCLLLLVLRVV